jgi:hypothetical protein
MRDDIETIFMGIEYHVCDWNRTRGLFIDYNETTR